MEDQNRPRRDLKGLWLLPVLVLGLGVFVASWKKPPLRPPMESGAFGSAEQMKHDVYIQAKYQLSSQLMGAQPKGYTVIGFPPYRDGIVTALGPARFRCSGFLNVRSQTGEVQREHWQCIIIGEQNNWTCKDFLHTPPERVPPSKAASGANIVGMK